MFVLDDGWFGERNDDDCALGDWYPNEKKLGCTLKELGEKITKMGLGFGLWFEPEAISEDSALYRMHPDWAVTIPGRQPELSRKQLMLDFSRQDVCQYIIDRMSSILAENPISYVKWDLNRSICDKYSHLLDARHQGEFSHRYILGLYHVLETLTHNFPDVLFEGCSGGGGRFDAGMLYYTPQIWCSDNSDAINRLDIQYGTSFGYPVSTMGAHVSAVPNHQTGRITPLETRGTVAMAGTFGYELDITILKNGEKKQIKKQIQEFREFYELIQKGNYYRLTTPEDTCTIWEFADTKGREALICGVYHGIKANAAPVHICVRGLCDDEIYFVEVLDVQDRHAGEEGSISYPNEKGTIMSGKALQNAGITVPAAREEFDSWKIQIRLVTLEQTAAG